MKTRAKAPLILCELGDAGRPELESYSAFCVKASRALKYAGADYTSRRGMTPRSFEALNPAGQVPVLLVGDEVVCDTTRILSTIEQLFPGVFTKQLDARAAAEAWLWEEFADAGLSGFVIAAAWCDDRNWRAVRQTYFGNAPWFVRVVVAPMVRKANRKLLVARDVLRAGDDTCWARFVETLDKLERRAPTTGFWVGEAVSRADIAIFAQLQSLRAPMFTWQRTELESRRALVTYLDRVDIATRGEPLFCDRTRPTDDAPAQAPI